MSSSKYQQRLQLLQQFCKDNQLDGIYIPQLDPHHNEYIPDVWQRRTWACGFDGSAGDLLIMPHKIILWTDTRYSLQATQQLANLPITIMMQQTSIINDVCQYLLASKKALNIAVDPQTITINQAQQLQQTLATYDGELIALDHMIDPFWEDQPALPTNPATIWDGIKDIPSASQKIEQLQSWLAAESLDTFVINNLDAIAWLLNIRGTDVAYNPVCISYVAVTATITIWFVDPQKINQALQQYCQQQQITLQPYTDFTPYLHNLSGTLGLDFNIATWFIALNTSHAELINITNPITLKKSQKSAAEIEGMQQAHIKDGMALVEFFYWLENNWQQGVDEYTAAIKLNTFRQQQDGNQGPSFAPISSFADNGAIVHYAPQADTAKTITDSNLYLLDSGGQYDTGTTDVTRVIHLGTPTDQQKNDYTAVLKGHVDLAKAIFPKGTNGTSLDALARQYLWQQSLNFGHGTGHGVGCYLNVHEGPCGITPRNTHPLSIGQVVSNEPGLYRANEYGIRIENLQTVIASDKNEFGEFYCFKTLTMFPYALDLINNKQLTPEQRAWINEYHQTVFDTLAPLCNDALKQWLRNKTTPLQTPSI